ncbi:MAG: hypothetical protein MMC33_007018 [Icmadophila ericetorum]|nr:hypothetical protein [Icmadophila ericetorum]
MSSEEPRTDEDIQRRQFVLDTLAKEFGFEASTISDVKVIGRAFNNHVFDVSLTEPTKDIWRPSGNQPGVSPLPADTKRLIFRMPNIEAKVNEAVRVGNEVAAMVLMRNALAEFPRRLIPDVYGWYGGGSGNGNSASHASQGASQTSQHWILMEAMPGVPKAKEFKNRPIEEQRFVFRQMAEIFKYIQEYEVPSTVQGFGGLSFDAEGNVVAGSMTMPYGGPYASMADLYKGMFDYQLAEADKSELVKGWRGSGLRERLDKFAAGGIDAILQKLPADRQTLIHGDYNFQNLLFDKDTLSISALLDFDFSHIASPIEEYFYSFGDIHGLLCGPYEKHADHRKIREYLLHGFPSSLPASEPIPVGYEPKFGDSPRIQWTTLKTWDEELDARGVLRPRTVLGAGERSALYWFCQEVCQWFYLQERWVKSRNAEELEGDLREGREGLGGYLEGWGY